MEINKKDISTNSLNKYLFILINVLIVLGVCITWILITTNKANPARYVPMIICNISSAGLFSFLIYKELKELAPILLHINKKRIKFFWISCVVYLLAFIFSTILVILSAELKNLSDANVDLMLAINFGVTGFITLVSIGFYSYFKFKINLDIAKRKSGIEAELKKTREKIENKKQKLSDEEFKKIKEETIDTDKTITSGEATSGFARKVSKK